MTFVGKVLVVVQVVLSICFMAFAAAVFSVQTSWKDKYDSLKETAASQQTEARQELEQLQAQNDLLVKAENAATNQVGILQAQVDGLTTERDTLQAELKVERDANLKEQAVATRSETEAEYRRHEATTNRVANNALLDSREQLVAQLQQFKDEKFGREAEMEKLIARHEVLLLENADLKSILASSGLSTDPRDYENKLAAPPVIEGVVVNTRRGQRSGTEFIEVTLGSDDGLLEGHLLDVYRQNEAGGKYLGKIKIVHVEVDRAVGTLVNRARNGSIQRGDNVTTKL